MRLIFWDQGVKPHLVPEELCAVVSRELAARYMAMPMKTIPRAGEVFRIDCGGAMLLDAEWVAVAVDGTILEVPIRDIGRFHLQLLEAPARETHGHRYFKLHGNLHCVVLTGAQRRLVLRAWSMKLGEYHARAQLEAQRFAAAVAAANGGQTTEPRYSRHQQRVLN